jgi:hypothetical protein
LAARPAEVRKLIDHLVEARLLVVQARSGAESRAVEIVHESLIKSWRTLKRWLEESEGAAAFLHEVGAVARQWEARGRPSGLLWRGEAMEEARRFLGRHRGELPARERQYLHAVVALGARAGRLRRVLLAGSMIFLFALAAAAAAGFVMIREAEQTARAERDLAASEAERARAAERQVKAQLDVIEKKEQEKSAAEAKAVRASKQVRMSQAELEAALARTQSALALARNATNAERQAKAEVEALLGKERQRVKRLEQELGRVMTNLR